MKLYVLMFEPYHENSEVLGVFASEEVGMAALATASEGKTPNWDNSDTYELQEWDTETRTKMRHWINHNPYKGVAEGQVPPIKLGWRIEEQVPKEDK